METPSIHHVPPRLSAIRDAFQRKVRERIQRVFPVRVEVMPSWPLQPSSGTVEMITVRLTIGSFASMSRVPLAMFDATAGEPFGPLADQLLQAQKHYLRDINDAADAWLKLWSQPWYVRVWRALWGRDA